MTKITLKGNPINTCGSMLSVGNQAGEFTLVDKELNNKSLSQFNGKKVLITVPSLDTGVCSKMTKQFNELAKKYPKVTFMTVSADLPFAQNRFCSSEGVSNVQTLSMMRNKDFGQDYGLLIIDGPLAGILARSVMVLDEKNKVIYSELVPEIGNEPNYEALKSFMVEVSG